MKKYLMILIGILPLLAGMMIDFLINQFSMYGSGVTFFSAVFLVFWFLIGFKTAETDYDEKTIMFYSMCLCLVNYVLLMIQILVFHGMWFNPVGRLTQLYVLPTIRFAGIYSHPGIYYTTATMLIVFTFGLGVFFSKRSHV